MTSGDRAHPGRDRGPQRPPATRATGRRGLALALLAFSIWAGVFIARSTTLAADGRRYPSLADDAMISMRYAWHLAHGEGLVYNPGERVEGYTNLLWTLLMALSIAAFGREGGVLGVQLAGLLACLGTAALLPSLVERLRPPGAGAGGPAPGAAVLLLLTWYPLAHWSLLGMEAGVLALLMTLALRLALDAAAGRGGGGQALGAVLALLVLTRPDAALACLVLLLGAWPREGRIGVPRAVLWAGGVPAAAVAGHTLFRLAYYGDLIPNTARLKLQGFPLALRIENGWIYVAPFLREAAPVLGLVCLAVWRRRDRPALVVATLVGAALAYQVWVGGDAFPYWRMLVPVMPAAFALAACELEALAARFSRASADRAPRMRLGLSLALLVSLWGIRPAAREALFLDEPQAVAYARRHVEMFVRLDDGLEEGATLGVVFAGTLPYYAHRLPVVDFLGKADRRVAALEPDLSGADSWMGLRTVPGHNKYDLRYSILERRPTFVETSRWGAQELALSGLYVRVWRGGMSFLLRAGDPRVRWDRFDSLQSGPFSGRRGGSPPPGGRL